MYTCTLSEADLDSIYIFIFYNKLILKSIIVNKAIKYSVTTIHVHL